MNFRSSQPSSKYFRENLLTPHAPILTEVSLIIPCKIGGLKYYYFRPYYNYHLRQLRQRKYFFSSPIVLGSLAQALVDIQLWLSGFFFFSFSPPRFSPFQTVTKDRRTARTLVIEKGYPVGGFFFTVFIFYEHRKCQPEDAGSQVQGQHEGNRERRLYYCHLLHDFRRQTTGREENQSGKNNGDILYLSIYTPPHLSTLQPSLLSQQSQSEKNSRIIKRK